MNRTHPTWTTEGRLAVAARHVSGAATHLAGWYTGQPVQGLPAEVGGHNALTAIDEAIRALQESRAALVIELRTEPSRRCAA